MLLMPYAAWVLTPVTSVKVAYPLGVNFTETSGCMFRTPVRQVFSQQVLPLAFPLLGRDTEVALDDVLRPQWRG